MKKKKLFKSDFLFPKTSFLIGMGSIFNVAGNYYDFNTSENPDHIALCTDWHLVGNDINSALMEFRQLNDRIESNNVNDKTEELEFSK